MYLFQKPAVTIGVVIVLLLVLMARRRYELKAWQVALFVPIYVDLGLLSEKILYYFDYGTWGGGHFYGIIIILPVFSILICLLLRMNYLRAMDLGAAIAIFLLAFGKIACFTLGCCGGKALFEMSNGETFYFPSRSAEFTCALLMAALFVWMNNKKKYHGIIYGCFCLVYSVQRIFFEEMRIDIAPTKFNLPVAEFWCIFIFFMGIAWIVAALIYKKKSKRWQAYCDRIESEKLEAVEQAKLEKAKKKQAKQKTK
ncbi:MAG: prolipoprotein diacylglyceryl transferase [Clostridia bacterium]